MIKFAVNGICGKMGKTLAECISEDNGSEILFGVDRIKTETVFPVLPAFSKDFGLPDCIIDFSVPDAVLPALLFAKRNKIPIVVGTTGLSDSVNTEIKKASEAIPVLVGTNFSIAVCAMQKAVGVCSAVLKDGFDVEIREIHHKSKKDAPSGTALSLRKTIVATSGITPNVVSSRLGNEIGFHEVGFFGTDEEVIIVHRAKSKKIFALGALNAGKKLIGKRAGLYSVQDFL